MSIVGADPPRWTARQTSCRATGRVVSPTDFCLLRNSDEHELNTAVGSSRADNIQRGGSTRSGNGTCRRRSIQVRPYEIRVDEEFMQSPYSSCLLYTSDAADDLLCVDLG